MDPRLSYIVQKFVENFNAQVDLFFDFVHLWNYKKHTETISLLKTWANKAVSLKKYSIIKREEHIANILFGLQCYLHSIISMLEMWGLIKSFNSNAAWDKLIDAQEYAKISLLSNNSNDANEFLEYLLKVEKLVFPKPVFVSAGFVYKAGRCSICDNRFDQCEHKSGLIYTGQLCREIEQRDIKFEHVAIVESPRDKRCRITAIEKNGVYEDCFSGEKYECKSPQTIDGLRCKTIAYNTRLLPLY